MLGVQTLYRWTPLPQAQSLELCPWNAGIAKGQRQICCSPFPAEAQKVPTQANPEVMARWLPTEVPPGPPFRLMFQGSYNLPLIPQESGNPGTGAEINTQVAHRSGSSNPPGRNHMPPAKQGNLLKPRKEAGSSYPGTRKEFAARGLPLQLLQVCED